MRKENPETYKGYKESGIQWLGEIPNHWKVKRIKDLGEYQSGTFINADDLDEENAYPVFGGNGYRGKAKAFNHNGEYILIGRQGALCGNINYASGKFWATEHAVVVYKKKNINTKWYGEFLKVMDLNQYAISAAQPGLSVEKIKRVEIAYPPFQEQTAIANFLENETNAIDKKVLLLKSKISYYKELSKSLINESVFRGIDRSCPQKESGTDWIGQVPLHWNIVRVGNIFFERSEKVSDKIYSPLSVSMNGVVPQMIGTAKTKNGEDRKKVLIGDFVINSRSDRRGASGLSKFDGSVSVINIVLKLSKKASGLYYHYLFKSHFFTEQFYKIGKGIVDDLWSTKFSMMKTMDVPLPPTKEQIAIANYLERETKTIDAIVANLTQQIEKLEELRKTLTHHVIKGKLKVTDQL